MNYEGLFSTINYEEEEVTIILKLAKLTNSKEEKQSIIKNLLLKQSDIVTIEAINITFANENEKYRDKGKKKINKKSV
jgi:hypothetical protein